MLLVQDAYTEVQKTADEIVTASTTLQDDNHLFFTAGSGIVYVLNLLMYVVSPAAADFKFSAGEDNTATRGVLIGTRETATALNTGTFSDTTTGVKQLIWYYGWHIGAGGTFKVQWAQRVSDAGNTTLYAGSRLLYRPLP